jgi:plasmid stabilization system protein ParE
MRISITDEAKEQVANIADYLASEWSPRIRDNFLHKIDKAVFTISQMPFAFPEAENLPDIRRCVIHKYTSIYYRVKPDEIEILAVWDNRQDLWSS